MNQEFRNDWERAWYCVRAKPRAENWAAKSIGSIEGVEVFLPKTVPNRKKNAPPPQALFPGYLFANFDPVTQARAVQYAQGVSYVVRRNNIPIPVPHKVVTDLKGITNGGILKIPDLPHQVGDKVTIIAGLFKGASGKVTRLVSARERVKVLFEFLGRETEAEIDEDSLDFPKAHPMGAG